MLLLEEIRKIESTKTDWEVTRYTQPTTNKIHPVVSKCLELRELELDVQEWTNEFNSTLDQEEMLEINHVLDGHANDEDKHEQILEHLQEYWGGVQVSKEADLLMSEWLELSCNPMVKKTFLEAGVFFSVLPLITRYSNFDTYTSRVADWIMIDEVRHVRSARLLMRYFNLRGTKKLLALIEKTIRWILSSENIETQDKWVKRSLAIALSGKCDDFADESYRVVPGHFDQESNKEVKNGYSY